MILYKNEHGHVYEHGNGHEYGHFFTGGKMANVIEKHSTNINRAIDYINQQQKEHPDQKLFKHISDAGVRFNLTPKDEEFLASVFKREKTNP